MSERGHILTFAENVGQGFLCHSTPSTHWTTHQPQQVKMSSQGVMSSEKAIHSSGFSPIKGQILTPHIYNNVETLNMVMLGFLNSFELHNLKTKIFLVK